MTRACPAVSMSASAHLSSPFAASSSHGSSSVAEISRLKRKLAATHQQLDEARGAYPKKIPWV